MKRGVRELTARVVVGELKSASEGGLMMKSKALYPLELNRSRGPEAVVDRPVLSHASVGYEDRRSELD
jgi:hypothetical protein